MAEPHSLLNQVWMELSDAMNQMFQMQPMKGDTLIDLYNKIHEYLESSEHADAMLNGLRQRPATTEINSHEGQAEVERMIPGGELYYYLKNFLKERLAENQQSLEGEDLLRFYATSWERYQFLSKVINKLFMSLNNNWIQYQQHNGIQGIFDVYTTAMLLWQDCFSKEANRSLVQACMELILAGRHDKTVDLSLIRPVTQSYVLAGFTEEGRSGWNNRTRITASLQTYQNYFETPFLQHTEEFYKVESEIDIQMLRLIDYLTKIIARFEEEERRVTQVLHPTTREKLFLMLETILIKDKLDRIHLAGIEMLHKENTEDLRLLFKVFDRVNAHQPIRDELETYASTAGAEAIDAVKETAVKEPHTYVEAIIKVHKRFHKIVAKAFASSPGYLSALDKACGKFINNNAVTKEANRSSISAELLARYCDAFLCKRSRLHDDQIQTKISEAMVVFNYIEDKDVFEKFYVTLLANRLVCKLSASDDQEKSMVLELQKVCGFEYTSKMQRMFQDIDISKTLTKDYHSECEKMESENIGTSSLHTASSTTAASFINSADFSVMILSWNSWPFSLPPGCILPPELQCTYDSFTHFYMKKHSGRKLTWVHQRSKGDLQTLYTETKYILHVSTYQMVVLLLFNKLPRWTVERMQDETQIEAALLLQVLCGLLKSKLITCSEINEDKLDKDFKGTDIQMDYSIQISDGFKSKKVRIDLNVPLKSIEPADNEDVRHATDKHRKPVIEAVIIRTMKTRQTLKHELLMQEVIQQLSSRFKPKIPMIKKCIDTLIEKEYLERQSNDKDVLRYLA